MGSLAVEQVVRRSQQHLCYRVLSVDLDFQFLANHAIRHRKGNELEQRRLGDCLDGEWDVLFAQGKKALRGASSRDQSSRTSEMRYDLLASYLA